MVALATALLIYLLVSKLWSVLDPDSVRVTFGSPFRAVVTAAGQVALVVALAMVVSLTGPLLVAYIGAYVLLDLLAALVD